MFNIIQTAHAAEGGISVHLDPVIVGHVAGVPITATLLTVWLTMILLFAVAYFAGKNPTLIPSKLQSIFEVLVGGAYDYIEGVLESKSLAKKYFPVIMTIFVFILAMNWVGLLPGVTSIGFYDAEHHFVPLLYPPATDLNITIAFALIAFFTIEVAGVLAIGVWKYGGKFINFKGNSIGQRVLNFIIGLIELLSELARLVSFSFRLFGNIFAGKTLLLVVMFLATPYVLPVPLIAYEFFVGFIQAFIFAILTLYFIKLATEEPH